MTTSQPLLDGPRILLTGATGYIGGRLLRVLEERELRVRCLTRHPSLRRARRRAGTEVVVGDVLDRVALRRAMEGVTAAYYLVHSMGSRRSFEDEDRRAAQTFAAAAHDAGVRRIIYLGALASGDGLSHHLRSRQEVGRILRESSVPTVELRASIIIGSDSLSFELIRALVEKLPIMITPRWVRTLAQPIGVEDVLAYLIAALDLPLERSAVFEIGGPDRVSYADLMREYARQRGLRRVMVSLPVLTPALSSLWLGLVTPVYARVGRMLIDGLRNETVVRDGSALSAFDVRPLGMGEAIARALVNEDRDLAETRWSDALSSRGQPRSWGGIRFGSRLVDSRAVRLACPPAAAFGPIRRIGGQTGWYYGNALWRLRGFLDLLAGGPGLRRGRRDPETPNVGETIDCWRVEAYEPERLLRLAAEMRLPGRAWLQFEVREGHGGSLLRQTAIFDPVGLAGLAYWYALWPLHQLVFAGMLRGIARAARRLATANGTDGVHPTGPLSSPY